MKYKTLKLSLLVLILPLFINITNVSATTSNNNIDSPQSNVPHLRASLGTIHQIFPDAKLAKHISDILTSKTGVPYTTETVVQQSDLNQIHLLTCSNLSSLEGMQYLTELEWLYSPDGHISDVTPLSNLPKLWEADLANNQIKDVRPFANTPNLSRLDLNSNQISNISPLSKVRNVWVTHQRIILPARYYAMIMTVVNEVTDQSSNIVVPSSISDHGTYDVSSSSVTWKYPIPSFPQISYDFETKNKDFTGTVICPFLQ